MRYGLCAVRAPEDERDSLRRVRRRRLRRSLELVVVVTTLVLALQVLSALDWSDLERQIVAADRRAVALTVALLVLRWVVWNVRWRLALAGIAATAGSLRTFGAILAGAALNHLTPAFRVLGGLVRARYVSGGDPSRFGPSYGSVLWDQIVNQVVAGAASAAAFILLSWRLGRAGQSLVASLMVGATILLLPLLWRRLQRTGLLDEEPAPDPDAEGRPRWARAIAVGGRQALHRLDELLAERPLLVRAAALSALYVSFNIGAAWTAFAALGDPPSLETVFLAASLGVTLGALSGTPGGGLTTEAAMVACFVLLGTDRSVALAGTLLYRGLHYALVLALGLPSLALLEADHRRRVASRSAPQGG
jgi:uncharacterized membrane protein YbhN (UPF0104 family)